MTEDAPDRCRLYLITPPIVEDAKGFADAFESVLDAGDVACLQVRLKSADGVAAPDDHVLAVAAACHGVTAPREIPLLINDRPDLAQQAGAEGVHIGQGDAPYAEARALLGEDAVIGVTCHASRHLAMVAGEAGADYVAFGAFFPTATKTPSAAATPEILTWWSELFVVPSVAIGGVTAENCGELSNAGADFVAVSSGVWTHPDGPAAGVEQINAALQAI
ncbi:MAG: thiamine phosphate synthase [Pseudomonadota bacterium]